jgi:hypothetical protein
MYTTLGRMGVRGLMAFPSCTGSMGRSSPRPIVQIEIYSITSTAFLSSAFVKHTYRDEAETVSRVNEPRSSVKRIS